MFANYDCRRVAPLFLNFVQGRLTPQEQARVEEHLSQCALCRAQAEQYRQTILLSDMARQQLHPASQTNWQTVRAQLAQEQMSLVFSRRALKGRTAWGLAGVGLAAGLACVIVWTSRQPHAYPSPSFTSAPVLPGHSTVQRIVPPRASDTPVALKVQHRQYASADPPVLRSDTADDMTAPHSVKRVEGDLARLSPPAAQTDPSSLPSLKPMQEQMQQSIAKPQAVPLRPGLNAEESSAAKKSVGGDDLAYLNAKGEREIGLTNAPPAKTRELQARLAQLMEGARTGDTFVTVPIPAIAGRGTGAGRAALTAYQQQAAVIDTRLARRVRLSVKDTPLSAFCQRLTDETGIAIATDARTADENVTLYCNPRPLRDILRQISAHFGFQWLREGEEGAYRYQLTRSVRSQLLEEELRNQDQDEALIALDQAMEKYRKFRGLNTSQLREAVKTAKGEAATMLFPLTYGGWVPANLYFGLSPDDLQTLRGGEPIKFSMSPQSGERPLPPTLTPEILGAFDDTQITPEGTLRSHDVPAGSLPISAGKDIAITSELRLDRSQLGEFTLKGDVFMHVTAPNGARDGIGHGITLAQVTSPAVAGPRNAEANAKRAQNPDLQTRVTIEPQASCKLKYQGEVADVEGIGQGAGDQVTIGDVLEAIFKATKKDVIGDAYTRLYAPGKMTERNVTLFDALNRLGDRMRERWTKEEGWLKFRSASWFYDRPKEVPQRHLKRWAASRREHGALTLDDLTEITQLTNTQLDALTSFQGALARYDLQEWNFARSENLREHWRMLAQVPVEMRRDVETTKGLQCDRLPLALQKRFIALALHDKTTEARPGDRQVAHASLRIEYPAGHIPTDKPDLKPLMLGNPIVFYYKYGVPEKEYGQNATVIGPFNATIGGSEAMHEQSRTRQNP